MTFLFVMVIILGYFGVGFGLSVALAPLIIKRHTHVGIEYDWGYDDDDRYRKFDREVVKYNRYGRSTRDGKEWIKGTFNYIRFLWPLWIAFMVPYLGVKHGSKFVSQFDERLIEGSNPRIKEQERKAEAERKMLEFEQKKRDWLKDVQAKELSVFGEIRTTEA